MAARTMNSRFLRTASMLALPLASAALASVASANASNVPVLWEAAQGAPVMKGDTTCAYGDFDCNPCLADVQAQFKTFKDTGRESYEYWFKNDRHYAPFDTLGSSVSTNFYDVLHEGGHIQSFVRLPVVDDVRSNVFAATHSEKSGPGYLYFMQIDPWYDTPGDVLDVYPLPLSSHPGGMQAIGSYLVVPHEGDAGAFYEVYETSTLSQIKRTAMKQLPSGGAANVSVARLQNGGYVFLSSKSSLRNMYKISYASDIETLAGFREINETEATHGPQDLIDQLTHPDPEYRAENLSMITECGTGNLYAIGAAAAHAGPKDGGGAYFRDNLWVLYQLESEGSSVSVTPVDWVTKDRDIDCNGRASGTAFVDSDSTLHVYCHEKVIGDLEDLNEGGIVDFQEYWADRPENSGVAPGAPGGADHTHHQQQ
jgi:hypothetical protein